MDDTQVAVLLEQLRDQFKVFGEALDAVHQKVDRLEHGQETLREEVAQVRQDLQKLDTRLIRIDTKVEHVDARVENMDDRVARIEKHLDLDGRPATTRRTPRRKTAK